MARQKNNSTGSDGSSANLGFEAKLWLTADKLRNSMDAAEYTEMITQRHAAALAEHSVAIRAAIPSASAASSSSSVRRYMTATANARLRGAGVRSTEASLPAAG